MKRAIGIGLIYFLAFLGKIEGQNGFMDFHYQWSEYYIGGGWSTYKSTDRFTFDSVAVEINGQLYHERLASSSPSGDDWGHTQMYYRSDTTGKVFMSYFGFENLIFDYSLQLNDTFSEWLIVDQIDSITLINGERRKQLTMRCVWDDDPPTGFGYSYWIEGLGGTHGVYDANYSFYEECAFDADGHRTLCITRNDSLLYDNPDYDSCWYLPVAISLPQLEKVSIYPNPASSEITIETKDHLVQNVSVIDLLGNVIFIGKNSPLDISYLPPGYYFLKTELEDKQIIMKPFVKQ
jgi:hypothetical protein